jgi:hypothetical protein
MSDAPTPETDAMCICTLHKSFKATGGVVTPDFARRLERERDEWKAKFIKQNKDLGCEMMDPAGTIWDYASGLQRENVQLKREVINWKTAHDIAIEQRDRLAEALERILSYQGRFCEEDPESIAAEALTAVKGGPQ